VGRLLIRQKFLFGRVFRQEALVVSGSRLTELAFYVKYATGGGTKPKSRLCDIRIEYLLLVDIGTLLVDLFGAPGLG